MANFSIQTRDEFYFIVSDEEPTADTDILFCVQDKQLHSANSDYYRTYKGLHQFRKYHTTALNFDSALAALERIAGTEEKDRLERYYRKIQTFGLMYGQDPETFRKNLLDFPGVRKIQVEDAEKYLQEYLDASGQEDKILQAGHYHMIAGQRVYPSVRKLILQRQLLLSLYAKELVKYYSQHLVDEDNIKSIVIQEMEKNGINARFNEEDLIEFID